MKHPYKYLCNIQDVINRVANMKKLLETRSLQCGLITTKQISKGCKLDIFLLGDKNTTASYWNKITHDIQEQLTHLLGDKAVMYKEGHTTDRKFQARFTDYIMYDVYL